MGKELRRERRVRLEWMDYYRRGASPKRGCRSRPGQSVSGKGEGRFCYSYTHPSIRRREYLYQGLP
jgi:hypothetical protein